METDVVQIRLTTHTDAAALAEVYAEAWRGAYRGIIPHLSLERMIARRGERWWKGALAERRPLLVLDFDGAASGYVTYGRSRTGRTPFQGEIFGSTCIRSIRASALARSCLSAHGRGSPISASRASSFGR